MKYICNGNLFEESDAIFGLTNRAFQSGDFISEFVKVSNGKLLLWEEHYFNLMASMRIFRMKIPIEFTQEFFEDKINHVLKENSKNQVKIKISVFRNSDKNDFLTHSSVSYAIQIDKVFSESAYNWENEVSEIEVFRDFTVNPSFFSQLDIHRPEEIIAQAFKQENEYRDLILLNPEKRMARSLEGSPFLIQGNRVVSPPITEGGIRSVTRNHLCKLLKRNPNFEFEEAEVFPFEMQKSDELFICVESEGILSIHQSRKKTYSTEKTKWVHDMLNESIELN